MDVAYTAGAGVVGGDYDPADVAVTLDDFKGAIQQLVQPPGDAGGGGGVHMGSVGVAVSNTPVEVMLGRGDERVHGVRVDFSQHTPCGVTAQALSTGDGCHGTICMGILNKWRAQIMWDTEVVPHACETTVKLGSMTGSVSWFGGLGPYGLVLSGMRHLTLATRFDTGGYGAARLGWRLLSDGTVSDVGVLYEAQAHDTRWLRGHLLLDAVYATVVGAPFCNAASVTGGVMLRRQEATYGLLHSTSNPEFQGKPTTHVAVDAPLGLLRDVFSFTSVPRAVLRCGAAHDREVWYAGGLASMETSLAAVSVGVDYTSTHAAPTVAVQLRFM